MPRRRWAEETTSPTRRAKLSGRARCGVALTAATPARSPSSSATMSAARGVASHVAMRSSMAAAGSGWLQSSNSGTSAAASCARAGRIVTGSAVELRPTGEVDAGGLDVGRAHQGLADQDGVDADALELVELVARGVARLGDDGLARGHVGEQLVGPLDVDREIGQVAVVEAEHVGLDVQGDLQLALVVDLDQRVEIEVAGLAQQVIEVVGVERRDDQQDRVGAHGRGLVELVGVDDEVLAQDRQLGRRERLAQVVERAAEVERLGQDRQRGRAAALVGLDDLGDRRALADHAGRRRAALVLGDQRHAGARERLLERALLRAVVERALELRQRGALAAARDLVARVVDDAVEDVHATESLAVRAVRASSEAAAAPALNSARSRSGPGSPARIRRVVAALTSGRPGPNASGSLRARPTSSGAIS